MAERDQLVAAIENATYASSIHNAQPWRFEILGDSIAVHLAADETPRTVDPVGRWALALIGAVVANLELALEAATGQEIETEVRVGSVPPEGELAGGVAYAERPLAVVTVTDVAAETPRLTSAERLAEVIRERFTTREPLTGGAPSEVEWAEVEAAVPGSLGIVVGRRAPAGLVSELLRLTAAAELERQDDADYLEEVEAWVERTESTGIPAEAVGLPDAEGRIPTRDFNQTPMGSAATGEAAFFEHEPSLLLLASQSDSPLEQFLGGYGMQRAMLQATTLGLGIGVLGQALEEPDSQAVVNAAASEALGGDVVVHQILRLGHPASPLTHPRTPRRPVAEVIL
ncbi:hypothetical protein [Salana multivorans]